MTRRVALVGGPMYDGLYATLGDEVEVVVHADHPTLNRAVAELLGRGERLDVISTHGKYAPSQAAWLRPLDDLVEPATIAALAPGAVELCRVGRDLLSLPRNIDVRVLWYRADRVGPPPDTWADVLAGDGVFGFPGRESGLFGTFFELVVGSGGALFDADDRPTLDTPVAVAAIETLQALAAKAPPDLPSWHYDEVDRALIKGRVDLAATWPGGYGALRTSPFYPHLAPAPYPSGPVQRVSYAGCHSWAIPRTCADVPAAAGLVQQLCSAESARVDALAGTVVAHVETLAAVTPLDTTDARRLEITRETVASAMITYPPLTRFPVLEDAGWQALHDTLRGRCTPTEAVERMQAVAGEVVSAPGQAG